MNLYFALARRLTYSVLVVLAVLTAIFLLLQGVGDAGLLMAGPEPDPRVVESIREAYGLNDPIWVRYVRSLLGWLHGDFGMSIWQAEPAFGISLARFPATLLLTGATLIFAGPLGLLMGLVSARSPGSPADRIVNFIGLAGVSVANFWLALMLILVFSVRLRLFPTSGMAGPISFVLPAIAIGMRSLGRISQLTRSTLLIELQKPYIVTARSKGLTDWHAITRHALPNAWIPIITLAGDELAYLIGGVVVVETVFGIPGIGGLLTQAIEHRDVPLVASTSALIAVSVVVVNLLVDASYYILDPRIRRP